ncbi:helix-turn-helix domain-containing protein [Planococcus halotolerans]|uniref:XRE family transcriptional regulator n=1 Tax=Planococcus halotolerans TaxID=2233542 RepID=A0A365KKC5_9BACL|nr:helix-turn-helix transcriptional regulator [Planococcus halotolerans]RAZ73599.1 XRE family transcriptional regulator [Planococcus halotolerans]
MDLGKRIVKLRESKNWNQRELARRVNLNVSVMNRIESGERPARDHELVAIANALDVTTDQLLGREEKNKTVTDMAEFEEFLNDPKISKLYSEYKESSEERREALLAAWEYLKSLDKK